MVAELDAFLEFASRRHPLDLLPLDVRVELARAVDQVEAAAEEAIYEIGTPLSGLYFILSGAVKIETPTGEVLSHLTTGDAFGERGQRQAGEQPGTR